VYIARIFAVLSILKIAQFVKIKQPVKYAKMGSILIIRIIALVYLVQHTFLIARDAAMIHFAAVAFKAMFWHLVDRVQYAVILFLSV